MVSIEALKSHLHSTFSIKDLGKLHYFLGIEVTYVPDGIILSKKKFTSELLQCAGIDLSKRAVTPLRLNLKLQAYEGVLLTDPENYRSLVSKPNFLCNTRLDLSYAGQSLSQFMQSPCSTLPSSPP